MEEMVIDARDAVAGRLASRVSKELLKGKRVYVVNAEKAVVSGDPKYTMRIFEEKIQRIERIERRAEGRGQKANDFHTKITNV